MSVEKAVNEGATILGEVESDLRKIQSNLSRLPKVFQAVHEGAKIGYLESAHLGAQAKELAGDVASVEAAVFSFHRHLTMRAAEEGIDLPQPRSGSGR